MTRFCLVRPSRILIRCRSITPEEWRSGIEFLAGLKDASAPLGQELNRLSEGFGMTALVDWLDNPRIGNATESNLLGPYFTEDAPDRS
jgi:Catechol dioxygenase N terminus